MCEKIKRPDVREIAAVIWEVQQEYEEKQGPKGPGEIYAMARGAIEAIFGREEHDYDI